MVEKAFDRYRAGEALTGVDFVKEPDCYETIFEDMKSERATGQFDLYGEIHIQKLPKWIDPPINPEQEHLCRPVILNTGVTRTITSSWGRYEGK